MGVKRFILSTGILTVSVLAAGSAADAGVFLQPGSAALPVIAVSDPAPTNKVEQGARDFIDAMARKAIGFLGDAALSQEQKKAAFGKLLKDNFDMETIGRFALGRYWRTATPEQRKEYQRLFRDMIVKVYSSRFEDYKGQAVEVRSSRPDGEKDTLVTSFIVPPDGPEIQVDWRVRYKNNQYQVVDILVEGVSMSVTQRSDFAAVIQRGGGDLQVLLTHLKGT